MSYHHPVQPQVLYQADTQAVHTLKAIRDRIHHICKQHTHHFVRLQTVEGHVYEGVIVSCDEGHVYLSVPHPHGHRGFWGPVAGASYYNVILPLVLYNLLVITLLYT
ncbi:hypothetical protein ACFQI7_20405 [Paenibacillus allorhizosphaerae]|uniref:Acetyl-CoA acetyltransferase n=1 Tax=Paenibacillus allorhizosphaerae TaxID=2849866 RepID=A0ABM8VKV6_9BACL|nr:hypothetical protein [Paenibacillus allorhizosphaerae]CAG7647607.1 hypothetical protein PAECIP111802_04017 [Paenibacillus allorhizosphaerae]